MAGVSIEELEFEAMKPDPKARDVFVDGTYYI